MKSQFVFALIAVLLCGAVWAADPDPVFPDVQALSSTPLNAKVTKTYEKDGIVLEEVMYHSEMDGEKSVDIFGIFGYPKGAKNAPAFIWNQGGLYQANDYWVIYGAKRGFAVLCIDFPIGGYRSTGGYPINSGLTIGDDPAKSPIAHGVVALLKGVSFLESRPEVDKNRIGMAGSSWGGFYTTLMVGIDHRLKAGSCFFGTGSQQLGNTWISDVKSTEGAAWAARWAKTLDPALRLPGVKTPINWCTGTNDFAYWMPALMRTISMAGGPTHLALKPNWDHSMTPNLDDEVFGYLDTQLAGKPAFPQLTPITLVKQGKKLLAQWSYTCPPERKITAADLILSYGGDNNWHYRPWITLPATVKGTQCTVELPKSSMPYYISGAVTDADTYRHSTPLLLVNNIDAKAFPQVDGCAEWGSFEKEQLEGYDALHGYPGAAVSTDAKAGKQSAELKAGTASFPPVHFIAGLPTRLSCYMKTTEPTEVVLQLSGQFDNKRFVEKRTVTVGAAWTLVSIEVPTEEAVVTSMAFNVIVPAGKTVLLDDVQCVPIKDMQ